jgi:hypothetical protein
VAHEAVEGVSQPSGQRQQWDICGVIASTPIRLCRPEHRLRVAMRFFLFSWIAASLRSSQ